MKHSSNSIQITYYMIIIFITIIFLMTPCLKSEDKKWTSISHDNTNFPLQGKHKTVACNECHLKGLIEGTPTDCEGCHWYRKRDDPYHLQLGVHCADCHSPFDWKKIKANCWHHSQVSGLSLNGPHKMLDCRQCHKGGYFNSNTSECYSCHQTDFSKTQNPSHLQTGFSTDCQSCHIGQVTWLGARYTHISYLLKGIHKTLTCNECHQNSVYKGRPGACMDCHLDDYNNTKDVNHKKFNFSTDCITCHSDNGTTWENAKFNHTPYWPLTGSHKGLTCKDCHSAGTVVSRTCYNCHRTDYEGTQAPNHSALKISRNCTQCHSDNATNWQNTTFNHNQYWPLKGNHKTQDCNACHKVGVNISTDCYHCHKTDYSSTKDPNHVTLKFSTDCLQCHSDNAITWKSSTFDHNQYWPLEGAHKTVSCDTCHKSGATLPNKCYQCHKADYNSAINPNHKTFNFPTNCEMCHYKSHISWSQAVFSHSFPIKSGKHQGFSCDDCHKSPNIYVFTCLDCHAHDKTLMDTRHQNVGGYAYSSAACYSCHPNGK